MSFAEETFEAFKAIALKHELLADNIIVPEVFLWRLEHWSLDFIFHQYQFSGQLYDNALVLQPAIRNAKFATSRFNAGRGKEFNNRQIETTIAAWSSATNSIKFLSCSIRQKHFLDLHDAERVMKIANGKEEPNRFSRRFNTELDQQKGTYKLIDDFEAVDKAISRTVSVMVQKLPNYLYRGALEGIYPLVKRRRHQNGLWLAVHEKITPAMGVWLQQYMQERTKPFKSFIDTEAKESVLAFSKSAECKKIDLYNQVVSAPREGRLREFRIGALNVLRPIGWRFADGDAFWEKIDRSQPILNIVGDALRIYPTTVSDFIRHGDILCKRFTLENAKICAPYAEYIDTSSWPTSGTEATYFLYMCEYAHIYAKAFDVLPEKIMGDLARELDRQAPDRWQKLLRERLRHQQKEVNKAGSGYSFYKIPENDLMRNPLLNQFRVDTESIKDMRKNIAERMITPLLLLEFMRQGFEVFELSSIDHLKQSIEQQLWSRASPSEQIEASSYWHSEKVKFKDRMANASLVKADTSWKSLIEESYKIKMDDKAVTVVALDSQKKLTDESARDKMDNCLYNMAINCLRDRHHIFSLYEGKDKPVASFTCVDSGAGKKPYVTFLRIEGPKRVAAEDWTRKVADAFIKEVNNGSIKVDWQKVFDSKIFYLQNQVDITVGFDFRDPAQMKRVCEVYQPLWPRKISSSTATNPAVLAKHLGIPDAVTAYLSDRDNKLRVADFRPLGKTKAADVKLAIA